MIICYFSGYDGDNSYEITVDHSYDVGYQKPQKGNLEGAVGNTATVAKGIIFIIQLKN